MGEEDTSDESISFQWRTLGRIGGQWSWEAVPHRCAKHGALKKVPAGLCQQQPSEVTARTVFHGMTLSNPACAPNMCSSPAAPLFLSTRCFLKKS